MPAAAAAAGRALCLDSAAATADCLIASCTLFVTSTGSFVPAGISPWCYIIQQSTSTLLRKFLKSVFLARPIFIAQQFNYIYFVLNTVLLINK